MCEQDDLEGFAKRAKELTRRQFGAIAFGATVAASLPRLANAKETAGSNVEIQTSGGTADAHFVPPVSGKNPAVLIWPDFSACALPSNTWPLVSPSPATPCSSSILSTA